MLRQCNQALPIVGGTAFCLQDEGHDGCHEFRIQTGDILKLASERSPEVTNLTQGLSASVDGRIRHEEGESSPTTSQGRTLTPATSSSSPESECPKCHQSVSGPHECYNSVLNASGPEVTPLYDPKFGDDIICARYKCKHSYYRHFDTYQNMRPVGCKYCSCEEFVGEVLSTKEEADGKHETGNLAGSETTSSLLCTDSDGDVALSAGNNPTMTAPVSSEKALTALDWLAENGWSNQYLSKDGWKTKFRLADLLEAFWGARETQDGPQND